MSVLIFILGLPVAVYVYASMLAVLDARRKVKPLVRLVLVLLVILATLLFTNPQMITPLSYSLLTVIILHWSVFFAVRSWGLGMPTYGNQPPVTAAEPDADEAPDIEHEGHDEAKVIPER